MHAETLLQSLVEQTRQIINHVEKLREKDWQYLNFKVDPNVWSIAECLEHLNLYGDFYLPQMEKKIKASTTTPDITFKSGYLGKYFAKTMLPKEKLNKMKTFKNKNPLNTQLDKTVVTRFMDQQIKLLDLLSQSRKVSLNKIKINTSISNLISLKLGDTFQFYVNHMLRHMKQIEGIEAAMPKAL